MSDKLITLSTQRVNLSIAIVVLQDELHDTKDMSKKFEIAHELAQNQIKLQDIEREMQVEELNRQWVESNVYDKPITVILKGL